MNARGNIDRLRAVTVPSCPALLEIKDTINEVKYRCLQLLVEVIYQTGDTVFHRDIQTLKRELKIRRAVEYF